MVRKVRRNKTKPSWWTLPNALALFFCCTPSIPGWAAPEEIQVYMDEMNAPGEFGLDVHNNYVVSGNGVPDYRGAQAPRHVFRVTPEFSYGLTPNLELGAYILSSVDANGGSSIDGQKLRLKFIAPKDKDQAYFWGANLEVGRVAHRLDENPWNAELKGILGYRTGPWTYAVNLNIDWKVSGPVPSPTTLDVDTKISYKTDRGYELGIESYNELGAVRQLGHLNQQSQTIFGVIDTSIRGWDVNIGVGRGLTPASDRWLLKAIVSVPLRDL
ncbi:hypothetical protein [Undibacterium sp.]|jgi:hypothetical protein|uniref:hypothetical protein n=1 Tax=Undibacterium sp. TaxID=1914977 RepID=UPI002CE1C098|nr:hypothetical protein [Undibacterium sp.]HTD05203.1 hypothetical protein [Undibacterium sp.]